jgi:hypothetical protein
MEKNQLKFPKIDYDYCCTRCGFIISKEMLKYSVTDSPICPRCDNTVWNRINVRILNKG